MATILELIRTVMRNLAKPRVALKLLNAAIRDHNSFLIMLRAFRSHRAIQKPLEIYGGIRFLKNYNFSTVLEIGSRFGGTLYIWSQLAQSDARLVDSGGTGRLETFDPIGGITRRVKTDLR